MKQRKPKFSVGQTIFYKATTEVCLITEVCPKEQKYNVKWFLFDMQNPPMLDSLSFFVAHKCFQDIETAKITELNVLYGATNV